MIGMLLNHPEFRPERLGSLRTLTYGASPMPGALLDELLTLFPGIEIFQGYGMTESSAVLTMLGPEEHRKGGERLRSAGRPLMGVVLSIQDPTGAILPTGETGEVCARAGNFMREYWNKPDATDDAFRGGWYHSGDAGYLDRDGYLYLVDRVKDMIVTGGENVYPAEVESVLAGHPAVADVAVIGVPDDVWGESVKAIVVRRPGQALTESEFLDWSRGRLAGYKRPRSVDFIEAIPRNPSGKVLKRELRAPYWTGQSRQVH
jgi:acyl-CoA synthetase (AMP-forming)/AMP-acid ligase II